MAEKQTYQRATITMLGSIEELTLGNGGSSPDMFNNDQRGGGNNGNPNVPLGGIRPRP